MKKICCTIYLLFSFMAGPLWASPEAENGILDLRGQNLDEAIELRGSWEFIWQKLLGPADWPLYEDDKVTATIPGSWNLHKRDFPIDGYGSYRLQVLIDQPELLA